MAKPMSNADLARLLDERAEELGAEGANVYRIRAYRRAARNVENEARSVADMVAQGLDLRQIPGVGDDLAAKLRHLVETGTLPPRSGRRPDRPRDRRASEQRGPRMPVEARRIRPLVETVERRLRHALEQAPGVTQAAAAGSYRRLGDTIGDLDFVVAGPVEAAREALEGHPEVERVLDTKPDRVSFLLTKGMRVDVLATTPESFGAALALWTGSRAHGEALVVHAASQGLRLAEDGLWRGRKRLPAADEAQVFAALGLPPIPPELREGDGEVAAAAKGALPRLVEAGDLKGDLHTHTVDSDGANTLETMARAAAKRGLSYIAVTDHTPRTAIANGMHWDGFLRQHKLVDRLNQQFEDEGLRMRILKGAEVDILKDGRLDLPHEALEQLDVVVASLHFRERQSGREHTERVLAAMGTGKAHILGHPSGRLIGRRPPMEHDWTRLLQAAKDQGWAFEVDGSPWRQDVWGSLVREGKRMGVRFAVDSDAHSTHELEYQRHALEQARKGWLEKADVLNTRTAAQLLKMLH